MAKTKEYICYHCFEEYNLNQVQNYYCKSCEKDVSLREIQGSNPRCPECRRPLYRICPNDKCGTQLDPRTGRVKDPIIAIVGPIFSGKSNYLGVLLHMLDKELGPLGVTGNIILNESEYRNKYEAPLYTDHTVVPKTRQGEIINFGISLDITKWGYIFPRKKNICLAFYDFYGELVSLRGEQIRECLDTYERCINKATGIILLINPIQRQELDEYRKELEVEGNTQRLRNYDDLKELWTRIQDSDNVLNNVIAILRQNDRRDVLLALAVTKVDNSQVCEYEVFNKNQEIINPPNSRCSLGLNRRELKKISRICKDYISHDSDLQNIPHRIKNVTVFRDAKYFACSALGQQPQPDPDPRQPDRLPNERPQPKRVQHPLLWILWKCGYINAPYDVAKRWAILFLCLFGIMSLFYGIYLYIDHNYAKGIQESYQRASGFFASGEISASKGELDKAIKLQTFLNGWPFGLGKRMFLDYNEKIETLESDKIQVVEATTNKLLRAKKDGDFKTLQSELKNLAKICPQEPTYLSLEAELIEITIRSGISAIRNGDIETLEKALKTLEEICPNKFSYQPLEDTFKEYLSDINKAKEYLWQGKIEKVLQKLEEAESKIPNTKEINELMTRISKFKEYLQDARKEFPSDFPKALESIKKAQEIFPNIEHKECKEISELFSEYKKDWDKLQGLYLESLQDYNFIPTFNSLKKLESLVKKINDRLKNQNSDQQELLSFKKKLEAVERACPSQLDEDRLYAYFENGEIRNSAGISRKIQYKYIQYKYSRDGSLMVAVKDGEGKFFIDQFEVTNSQFKRFIDANWSWQKGGPKSKEYCLDDYLSYWKEGAYPNNEENMPVRNVSFYAAKAYAEWAGKDLPSESQWNSAARGETSNKYTWGNKYNLQYTNRASFWLNRLVSDKEAAIYRTQGEWKCREMRVGSFFADESHCGCYDMDGNLSEWTATKDKDDPQTYVIKGANFESGEEIYLDKNDRRSPKECRGYIGFRCVWYKQ